MMRPERRSRMCAAASRVHRNAERRLRRMMKSQSSTLASQMWPDVPPPTSLTRMSSRPCASSIDGEQRLDRRLLGDVGGDRPCGRAVRLALICRSVSASPAASMSASTSEAPSSASRSAIARPSPAAAPVTSAILPATRRLPPLSPPSPARSIGWQVKHACRMASIGQDENRSVDRMVETSSGDRYGWCRRHRQVDGASAARQRPFGVRRRCRSGRRSTRSCRNSPGSAAGWRSGVPT